MYYLAFFSALLVVVATLPTKIKTNIDPVVEECAKQVNVSLDAIIPYLDLITVPEDNTDLQKVAGCCARKKGIISENGDLLWDVLHRIVYDELKKELEIENPELGKRLKPKHVTDALDFCEKQSIKEKTAELTVIKLHNCMFTKLPETLKL